MKILFNRFDGCQLSTRLDLYIHIFLSSKCSFHLVFSSPAYHWFENARDALCSSLCGLLFTLRLHVRFLVFAQVSTVSGRGAHDSPQSDRQPPILCDGMAPVCLNRLSQSLAQWSLLN